ncbi:MAG: flagellar motor switch protein FliG, partial [Phenylobacterium sp.]
MNAKVKGKNVTDGSKLSGPEKAAVVLLALGEEHASVWQQFDEDEVKEVSQAMAGLGSVSSQVVEDLLVEFVTGMTGSGTIMGSYEQTQRLLASIMPGDKVDALMEEISGPAGRTMW